MFDSSKRYVFYAGVVLGFAVQVPYVYWLEKHPRIVAEPVPREVYENMTIPHTYVIRHVPAIFGFGPNNNLRITVTTFDAVNEEAVRQNVIESIDIDPVAGFYDPVEHQIWCVDSIVTLIHELKHVFEKRYHR